MRNLLPIFITSPRTKKISGLNVKVVHDYRGYFMDTDCRWPGSCHDAKIFANSSSVNKGIQDKLQMLFKKVLPGKERTPTYLFCDPTYPLKVYCTKKFESSKRNARVIFSSMLSLTRNPTEGGFGRLKAMCEFWLKESISSWKA